MRQFFDFVRSEINELESRDADQLYECIRENLQEMGIKFTDSLDNQLYNEIEIQLKDLKMKTYTPGPWNVFAQKETSVISKSDYPFDADTAYFLGDLTDKDGNGGQTTDQCEANVRLINSAPDLLEALQSMYTMYKVLLEKSGGSDDSIMFNARTVIAKATGGAK